MRRLWLKTIPYAVLLTLALSAPAQAWNDGRGFYGPSSDKAVTNMFFGVIIFFPAVIVLFSVIQWRLDKRKHAREDAQRARERSADWRGGW